MCRFEKIVVLGLFSRQEEITSNDVARVLGLSAREAREILNEWTEAGWREINDAARKTRRYRLSAVYRLNNDGFINHNPAGFRTRRAVRFQSNRLDDGKRLSLLS